jgi:DNA-binding transcriptional LysR family regulator
MRSAVTPLAELPSFHALIVLEAAARHRGFTAAARELGVTQAAVSRQIASLEEQLGVDLFRRMHRRVEPTQACLELAAVMAGSLERIGQAVQAVRAPRDHETLTIGATLAFSTFWLMPRLAQFRLRHPNAQIRVIAQDSPINLHTERVDVVVRYGSDAVEDGVVVASRADQVYPVCSAGYARAHGLYAGLGDVNALNLIDQEVPDRAWYSWRDWLARVGLGDREPNPSLLVTHYSDVMQAARDGQGVALGWDALVREQVRSGVLVAIPGPRVDADGKYRLIVPSRRRPNPLQEAFIDWLHEAFEET